MRPVYFISSYDVTDSVQYEQVYVPGVKFALAETGGEVIVATGTTRPIEGDAAQQTVVFRFPSSQAFYDWYDSKDYAPLLELRRSCTTNARAVLVHEFNAT